MLTVQVLRFLREHGHRPKLIERCYRKVPHPTTAAPVYPSSSWPHP